jgi:Flp pilus assembly protein TadD
LFQHSLICYSTLRRLALVVLWSVSCSASNADDLFDAGTIDQLIKNNQLILALEKVDQWLDLQPDAVVPSFLKARILTTDGKSDQAVTIYEKLIAVEPDLPEAYNNLGLIYAAGGNLEKATKYFQLGLQTNPTYATLYQNLSTLYAARAISAYRKALLGAEADESSGDSRTLDLLPLDMLGKH